MTYDPHIHHRRSIRLATYDYSEAGAYFVTLCTHHREWIFGEILNEIMHLSPAGEIVKDEWLTLAENRNGVDLDEWIIMPNHFHALVMLAPEAADTTVGAIHESPSKEFSRVMTMAQRRCMTLSRLIGRIKMVSAKGINVLRGTPGTPVWQRNYWEHVVRNETELLHIRAYIRDNTDKWEEDRLYRPL